MNQLFTTPKKRLSPYQAAQMKDAVEDLEYRLGQRLILEANPSRYQKMYDRLESWRSQLGYEPHSSTVAEYFKPVPELHLIQENFANGKAAQTKSRGQSSSVKVAQRPRQVEDDPNYRRLRKKKEEALGELKTFPQTGPLTAPQSTRRMQLVLDLANLDLQLKKKRENWDVITIPGIKGIGNHAAQKVRSIEHNQSAIPTNTTSAWDFAKAVINRQTMPTMLEGASPRRTKSQLCFRHLNRKYCHMASC